MVVFKWIIKTALYTFIRDLIRKSARDHRGLKRPQLHADAGHYKDCQQDGNARFRSVQLIPPTVSILCGLKHQPASHDLSICRLLQ
jgi:hypothetical protein